MNYEAENDELLHYGTPRHSGRYPYGSGDNPYQRNMGFLGYVDKLTKQGMSQVQIAKTMGMNTSELRKKKSLALEENRRYEAAEALRLHDKGMSNVAIGKRMGKNESSIRSLLNPALKERSNATQRTAELLKDSVANKKFVDVGSGVEGYLGVTSTKLSSVLHLLEGEGYKIYSVPVKQLGTGKDTTMKVLCASGTEWKEAAANKFDIQLPIEYHTENYGEEVYKVEPPKSIDSKRIFVRYAEDGGADRDGTIELRRGVDDISLGNAKYAQVRIAVDGTHYAKGMAVYADDIPDGYDMIVNSNKKTGTPIMGPDNENSVLKNMKSDPSNPFGATIKLDDQLVRAQRHYFDSEGNKQLSVLNIVQEEGDWNKWRKSLAAQFLSKQPTALAKQQLDISYKNSETEFNELMSLTNPTVKGKLLEDFAGQCDSAAEHLKAAALPRQATKVILPFPDMKENEIYAPHLRDGETVVLVRYPHAGTFEIPTLVVNNKHERANSVLGNDVMDAVGIHPKAAERLSGADFDGDTVLVIPVDNVKVNTSKQLDGLKDFNPRELYKSYPGMHLMTSREKGLEMGKVSNLITDMTLKGATSEELERAVKHSMVVIDAEKHKLDYKQSEIDNNIAQLKEKYQGGANAGASTLISRASSEVYINQRKEKVYSKMTPEEKQRWLSGEIIYEDTGKTRSKPHMITEKDPDTGAKIKVQDGWDQELTKETVSRMSLAGDANKLLSANPNRTELVYAKYANDMLAMAKQARAEARKAGDVEYDPVARKKYDEEYRSLTAKLEIAIKNSPLERLAQRIANKKVNLILHDNPDMDDEHRKKLRGQKLDEARRSVGAKKQLIQITEKEWEAINAGAISPTKLKRILTNSDTDAIRRLATPRNEVGLSEAKLSRARAMLAKGYTQADVADMLDISTSTLIKAIK